MPKRVGKGGELFRQLISDANLQKAISEVNAKHHWLPGHRPNPCTAWVELTQEERIEDLRRIIVDGFEQSPPRVSQRWDASAQKYRTICEPRQWPDQYVHHALVQVLQPVMMRGMDRYCCGSIRGRGAHYVQRAIRQWVDEDPKGTRYELSGDVRHFYSSLKPYIVMERMRRLIKDARVLDLIWRIIKDGVMIGFFTSQWFANVVLQPLDQMIRQSGLAEYYVRYMDNLTIFGPNKRKLHRLRKLIEDWLNAHELLLKGDWQVFRTVTKAPKVPLKEPRRGFVRPKLRMPDAVGYRYGRGYVIPRKHNFIRMKRAVARYRRRRNQGRQICFHTAASIMSRLGQLKHCNNRNLYKILFRGERIQRELKRVIREQAREEKLEWSMYLARLKAAKSSSQKEASTAT